MKISSVLNVPNDPSREPEEFSLKDIEAFVDSEEQNWFKRAHVGKFLGLRYIDTTVEGLDKCELILRGMGGWSGFKDNQNKTHKFLSSLESYIS